MTTYQNQTLIHQMNNLRVDPGCLAIRGLGQMGVALKSTDQRIIYIDPILSDVVAICYPELADRFKRAFPPPQEPGNITNAAYVLCTHEHLDHTDPLTLGPLAEASPQASFIISGWAHPILDEAGIIPSRRIVPPALQPIDLDGIRVTLAVQRVTPMSQNSIFIWEDFAPENVEIFAFYPGVFIMFIWNSKKYYPGIL